MERRDFLKFALGVAAGTGAIAATMSAASALPMSAPQDSLTGRADPNTSVKPAVADQDDLAHAKVEEVQWGHRHWRRRRYYRRHRRW